MTIVTDEMKDFIYASRTLSDSAIAELLKTNFGIVVSLRTINIYVDKARAEAALVNSSKVEAVREKILDNSNLYAAKYLQMLDDEIVALDKILKTGSITFVKSDDIGEESDAPGCLVVDSLRDRNATSQNLQKAVNMILQFVAPAADTNVNLSFKPDYSTLTDEELDALELIAVKTARKTKDAPN